MMTGTETILDSVPLTANPPQVQLDPIKLDELQFTRPTLSQTTSTQIEEPEFIEKTVSRRELVKAGVELLGTFSVLQKTDHTCGVGTARMIYSYWGYRPPRESQLAAKLGTTPDGTDPLAIQRVSQEFGFDVELRVNTKISDLADWVKKGIPVIVSYQAWPNQESDLPWSEDWEDGHYSVVIGVDKYNVYLQDPIVSKEIVVISHEDFMERWHDNDGPPGAPAEYYYQLALVIIPGKTVNLPFSRKAVGIQSKKAD